MIDDSMMFGLGRSTENLSLSESLPHFFFGSNAGNRLAFLPGRPQDTEPLLEQLIIFPYFSTSFGNSFVKSGRKKGHSCGRSQILGSAEQVMVPRMWDGHMMWFFGRAIRISMVLLGGGDFLNSVRPMRFVCCFGDCTDFHFTSWCKPNN